MSQNEVGIGIMLSLNEWLRICLAGNTADVVSTDVICKQMLLSLTFWPRCCHTHCTYPSFGPTMLTITGQNPAVYLDNNMTSNWTNNVTKLLHKLSPTSPKDRYKLTSTSPKDWFNLYPKVPRDCHTLSSYLLKDCNKLSIKLQKDCYMLSSK